MCPRFTSPSKMTLCVQMDRRRPDHSKQPPNLYSELTHSWQLASSSPSEEAKHGPIHSAWMETGLICELIFTHSLACQVLSPKFWGSIQNIPLIPFTENEIILRKRLTMHLFSQGEYIVHLHPINTAEVSFTVPVVTAIIIGTGDRWDFNPNFQPQGSIRLYP